MELFESIDGTIESFDSTKLYYVKDTPKKPRAVIVVVHGFGEHLGRYEYEKKKFIEYGYGVYRFDNRGHGRSGGERGYINNFEDFARDVDVFIEFVRNENPDIPIFMLGHSMGGFITALYGIMFKNKLKGQIFTSAATLEPIHARGIRGKFLKFVNRLVPKIQIKNPVIKNKSKNKENKEAVIDSQEDNLILKSATLNFYVQFLVNGIGWLRKNFKNYDYPCLILHGGNDKLVEEEAAIRFHSSIASTDKQIKIYEGLRHELLKEKEKDIILDDIRNWIEDRIRGDENQEIIM